MDPSFTRIDKEHRELRNTLEQLEDATDPPQMATLLERMKGQLVHHFAEEEGPDGLANSIASTLPQNQTHLDHLFEQHGEFLKRIELLGAKLAEIQTSVAMARDELQSLCEDLKHHEARETRLITDAVLTDIGPGD